MKKQTFLFSSTILILSALAAKLTGAIFRIPLANMLGGTGMGYFSSAYSIFMTVYAVSVTGLPAAVAKLTAEKSALQRYSDLRRVKSSALLFFSAAGLAFTAVTMLLAYPFCRFSGGGMAAMPAVLAIAPSVFFSCVTSVYRGYYEGLRNMFPTAVSQIIEGLVKLCSGLALCLLVLKNPHKFESFFVYFRDTEDPLLPIAAAAAVMGVTLSSAAGTLFLILRDKISGDGISREELSSTEKDIDSRRNIISALLKTAVPIAVGALVTNLTSLIDLVTIMRSLSSAAEKYPGFFAEISGNIPTAEIPNFLFGSFTGLAVTIFNLVPSCTNMFGKGILPAVSEAFAARDHKQVRLSTEKAMFATALVSFPSAVGICVLSGEILGTLFPTKPLETEICTFSLSILGIAVAFLCMSSTVFAILQAAGRPDLPVKLMLAGVAVKLAGNLLLVRIPQLNIAGAAISTLVCYTVICLPAIDAAVKLTNADISYLKGIFCKICYCSVMCGGSALLARNMLAEVLNPLPLLIISIFCGVIIYILTALLLGIITKNTLNLLIS
ncbi:MAG: polysaccharide biosynthesis protein [Oscillospiraceae bacterium]|nr:polysaccharide biosynthesis protein [Oscillospiraceae bacterium]